MQSIFKITLLAATGAALVAAVPASAKTLRHYSRAPLTYRADPPVFNPADPTIVIENGHYIGRDPDPQIRSELLKNQGDYQGNAY